MSQHLIVLQITLLFQLRDKKYLGEGHFLDFFFQICSSEVGSCKRLNATGNYLSKGELLYGWAHTPRINVNRLRYCMSRCQISLPGVVVLVGPGGDTSNLRSELDEGIYHDPRLVYLRNLIFKQTSIIPFIRRQRRQCFHTLLIKVTVTVRT